MKLKYTFATNPIGDEIVAVPVGKHAAEFRGILRVNEVAADILALLAEETTEEKIVESLAGSYDVPREKLTEDTQKFVARLREAGLLTE